MPECPGGKGVEDLRALLYRVKPAEAADQHLRLAERRVLIQLHSHDLGPVVLAPVRLQNLRRLQLLLGRHVTWRRHTLWRRRLDDAIAFPIRPALGAEFRFHVPMIPALYNPA